MGQKGNEITDGMESILGLDGEKTEQSSPEKKTDEENEDAVSQPESSDKKPEETTHDAKSNTVTMTPKQVEINKEITKIDGDLETLQAQEVDMDAFYAGLEEMLTDEEAELEMSDKPAYMKLVAEKAAAYQAEHSNTEKITELSDKKTALEKQHEEESAILSVGEKYPDFDYDKVNEFFANDLTKKEQAAIFEASGSMSDALEKTYKKYLETHPMEIKTAKAPGIPDVSDSRKRTVKPETVEDGFKSEEEQLREALGL